MKILMAMTLAMVVAILVVPGLVHAQVGSDAAVSMTVGQPAPGYGYGPYGYGPYYGPYYGAYPYDDPYLNYDPYFGPYFYPFL